MASRDWYSDRGIALHTGHQISGIDRGQKQIVTRQGDRFAYDALVLCTGSAPFVPPIEGVDMAGVFVYRTIEDLEAILAYAEGARSCAVLVTRPRAFSQWSRSSL